MSQRENQNAPSENKVSEIFKVNLNSTLKCDVHSVNGLPRNKVPTLLIQNEKPRENIVEQNRIKSMICFISLMKCMWASLMCLSSYD